MVVTRKWMMMIRGVIDSGEEDRVLDVMLYTFTSPSLLLHLLVHLLLCVLRQLEARLVSEHLSICTGYVMIYRLEELEIRT